MIPSQRIFALADDLTGALEVGAKFAGSGLHATVRTNLQASVSRDIDCLSVDAELRHLSSEECDTRTREILRRVKESNGWSLYLKTDSTLRGNIGAQFNATLSIFPERAILYVPAYPQLGRTVCGGCLHVDGIPVEQTAFANDPISPVRQSHLPALIRPHIVFPIHVMQPKELPARLERAVYICEGSTDRDVEQAAIYSMAHPDLVVAGPAAIAHALARVRGPDNPAEPRRPPVRSCLVVNGSKHPTSAEQCRRAREAGWRIVRLNEFEYAADQMNAWSMVDLESISEENSLARSAEIGRLMKNLIIRSNPDAVMVIGGDTCYGLLKAFGEPDLNPLGEIRDGVPSSLVEGNTPLKRDFCLISKAGGFGSPDLLLDVKAVFDRAWSLPRSSRS